MLEATVKDQTWGIRDLEGAAIGVPGRTSDRGDQVTGVKLELDSAHKSKSM